MVEISLLTGCLSRSSSGTTCATSLNTPFTLSNGQSCTLNLSVSGVVDGGDPNPTHHLMLCLSDKVTCAGPNPVNSLNVSPATGNVVMVGFFIRSDDHYQSGIVTSNNGGSSLSLQLLPLIPSYPVDALIGVSCVGATCIAVGTAGTTDGSNANALVAVSTNNGADWSQQALNIPAGYNTGYLPGVYCFNNQSCLAVGQYISNTTTNNQAVVAITQNTGASWSQSFLSYLDDIQSSALNGVTCFGETCIAVGYNETTDMVQESSVAVSTNAGSTWSQQVLSLPAGTTAGALNGVDCDSNVCIAVGQYTNSGSGENVPGVAISTNQGVTWSQSLPAVLSPYTNGFLNAISCTSSYCVAVGAYSTGIGSNAHDYAAVFVTQDHGVTWSQQALPIPAGYLYSTLNGVHCTGKNCIAAGYYEASSDVFAAFMAVSQDSGNTWSQTLIPSDGYEGVLYGVS